MSHLSPFGASSRAPSLPPPQPADLERSSTSAPAAAAVGTHAHYPPSESYVSLGSLSPPTREMLHTLTATPVTSMVARQAQGRKRGKKQKGSVARFYNPVAGRPYPRLTSLQQQIQVTLQFTLPNWSLTSVSVPTFASQYFTMSNFGGASAFLSVFDQYRFDQIEAWVETTSAQGTTSLPEIATCVDLDDANLPTTYQSVADHQQALIGNGMAARYHKWKPHRAIAAFSGAFTSYANEPADWCDSASPNIQHYGLKLACLNGGSAAAGIVLNARALISFRAPGIN